MDWHLLGMFAGYAVTVMAFLWKMGHFTGTLETILNGIKEEVANMKDHETKIARLDERVNNLEKRKR